MRSFAPTLLTLLWFQFFLLTPQSKKLELGTNSYTWVHTYSEYMNLYHTQLCSFHLSKYICLAHTYTQYNVHTVYSESCRTSNQVYRENIFPLLSLWCSSTEILCNLNEIILVSHTSLFRKKRFALNEMFQRNASKFAIFYV